MSENPSKETTSSSPSELETSEGDKALQKEADKDANTCIALGAGVGVFGTVGAIVGGAVCPLCVIVAPGLISLGVFQKWKVRKKKLAKNPLK